MPPPHLASLLRPAIDPSIEAAPPARLARRAAWLRPEPTPVPTPVAPPPRVEAPDVVVPLKRAEAPPKPKVKRERRPSPIVIEHRPSAHRAWLTLLALLLLGPLAHAAGAMGLPASGLEFGTLLGLPLPAFAATALFWCALVLPAVALATWRRAEPLAIILVALFWSWTALHAASAQGWLPPVVPPLPFG